MYLPVLTFSLFGIVSAHLIPELTARLPVTKVIGCLQIHWEQILSKQCKKIPVDFCVVSACCLSLLYNKQWTTFNAACDEKLVQLANAHHWLRAILEAFPVVPLA